MTCYRTIVADPPWQMPSGGRYAGDARWKGNPRRPSDEIEALPVEGLAMVEQVSPGPYVELFARRARFGWDYWGNESLGTADLAA